MIFSLLVTSNVCNFSVHVFACLLLYQYVACRQSHRRMGNDPARRIIQADSMTKMAQMDRRRAERQTVDHKDRELVQNDRTERFYCWEMWSVAFQSSSCPSSILRYSVCTHTYTHTHLSFIQHYFNTLKPHSVFEELENSMKLQTARMIKMYKVIIELPTVGVFICCSYLYS